MIVDATSCSIIISELLFILLNKYGNIPNLNLQSIIAGYYTEEKIQASKGLLYDFAHTKLGEKDIGRCMKRQGDDRKKLDVADTVQLFEALDKMKIVLSIFVAANMSRIPGMKPLNGDILSL